MRSAYETNNWPISSGMLGQIYFAVFRTDVLRTLYTACTFMANAMRLRVVFHVHKNRANSAKNRMGMLLRMCCNEYDANNNTVKTN